MCVRVCTHCIHNFLLNLKKIMSVFHQINSRNRRFITLFQVTETNTAL